MTDDELRAWAEAHGPAGSVLARGVLRLLAEKKSLQEQIGGHVERIAAQSELLSRKAEGKYADVSQDLIGVHFEQKAVGNLSGLPPVHRVGVVREAPPAFDGSTWDGASERSARPKSVGVPNAGDQ